MTHSRAFLGALKNYLAQEIYPFHTPGHKGGRGADPDLAAVLAQALAADISLADELADPHKPGGALLTAQKEAAELYGADQTFFAVNGTTGAVQAMLTACLEPGEKLLLARNAHRSAAGALIMSGARPIYIMPSFDEEFAVTEQPLPRDAELLLAREKDVKAVFLTSPSYYGLAARLPEFARLSHESGALLLVDEAHGAHLGFDAGFPQPALAAGADACAQSTHKLLGALTQSSLLHIRGPRINKEKIARTMDFLTTSSPNQLLLASLDAACGQLARAGGAMTARARELAAALRARLTDIEGLAVLDRPPGLLDPTKITVRVSGIGVSGFAAADFLRARRVAVELADSINVLFLVTYADDEDGIDRAADAVCELAAGRAPRGAAPRALPPLPAAESVLTPREAFYREWEQLPLSEAVGRIAAADVTFYPPGIPLVLPGELINRAAADYARELFSLRGGVCPTVSVVR